MEAWNAVSSAAQQVHDVLDINQTDDSDAAELFWRGLYPGKSDESAGRKRRRRDGIAAQLRKSKHAHIFKERLNKDSDYVAKRFKRRLLLEYKQDPDAGGRLFDEIFKATRGFDHRPPSAHEQTMNRDLFERGIEKALKDGEGYEFVTRVFMNYSKAETQLVFSFFLDACVEMQAIEGEVPRKVFVNFPTGKKYNSHDLFQVSCKDPVFHIAMSDDGDWMAFSSGKQVRMYSSDTDDATFGIEEKLDAANGEHLLPVSRSSEVTALALSYHGTWLASACYKKRRSTDNKLNTVQIVDRLERKLIEVEYPRDGEPHSLAFGSHFCTDIIIAVGGSSHSKPICIFNLKTQQEVAVLQFQGADRIPRSVSTISIAHQMLCKLEFEHSETPMKGPNEPRSPLYMINELYSHEEISKQTQLHSEMMQDETFFKELPVFVQNIDNTNKRSVHKGRVVDVQEVDILVAGGNSRELFMYCRVDRLKWSKKERNDPHGPQWRRYFLHRPQPFKQDAMFVALDLHGTRLVVGGPRNDVAIYNIEADEDLGAVLVLDREIKIDESKISSVSLSRQSHSLVVATDTHVISVFDLKTGAELYRKVRNARCVKIGPLGNKLLVGGWDRTFDMIDIHGGVSVAHPSLDNRDPDSTIQSVAGSSAGMVVASGSEDGYCRVYMQNHDEVGAPYKEVSASPLKHEDEVHDVEISGDGSFLAAGDCAGCVTIYDLRPLVVEGNHCAQIERVFQHNERPPINDSEEENFIWALEFSPRTRKETREDGQEICFGILAAACWNGSVLVFICSRDGEWQLYKEIRRGASTDSRMYDVSMKTVYSKHSGWKTLLATGSRDRYAIVYDLKITEEDAHDLLDDQEAKIEDFDIVLPPFLFPSSVRSVALSGNGDRLALSGREPAIWIVSVLSKSKLYEIKVDCGSVQKVDFSFFNQFIAAACDDCCVRVWRLFEQYYEPFLVIPCQQPVRYVRFSEKVLLFPDGQVLSFLGGGKSDVTWCDTPNFEFVSNVLLEHKEARETLLARMPTVANARDPISNESLLQYAVRNFPQEPEIIHSLLQAGSQCQLGLLENNRGENALMTAIESQSRQAVQAILQTIINLQGGPRAFSIQHITKAFPQLKDKYPELLLQFINCIQLEYREGDGSTLIVVAPPGDEEFHIEGSEFHDCPDSVWNKYLWSTNEIPTRKHRPSSILGPTKVDLSHKGRKVEMKRYRIPFAGFAGAKDGTETFQDTPFHLIVEACGLLQGDLTLYCRICSNFCSLVDVHRLQRF